MFDSKVGSLISVVVPVYNVEPYLRQCVESILAQTYPAYEIILVDDGSTDGSSVLCDQFALYNENVSVIHQKNRGLSCARNTGIEASTGDFITFVDSDDWLSPDYLDRSMQLIREYDADVCGVGFNLAYPDGGLVPNPTLIESPEVYGTEDALARYLFNTNLTVCVCGKVWKRVLWNQIRCPVGKLHEDQFTTYRLIAEAKKTVFNPEPLYYYRQREGSIGHSRFSMRSYDLLSGIDEQFRYIVNHFPRIEPQIGAACSFWYVVFVNMMLRSGYWDSLAAKRCQTFVRRHLKPILLGPYLLGIRKAQLALFAVSLPLYKKMYLKLENSRDSS